MRKALVIYRDRSVIWSGSERVMGYLVRVLKELNHEVTLITFDGAWDSSFPGPRPDKLMGSPGPNRFIKGINMLMYERLSRFFRSYDVIIDAAYNDLRGNPHMGYVHYPYCTSHLKSLFPTKADVIAVNSTWTLSKLRQCGVDGVVIHPPVRLIECSNMVKEDLVIGIGRLSKPWEEFIEVAKVVKAKAPWVNFTIIGHSDSEERVRQLLNLSQGLVNVIPNASEGVKSSLLCKAKAILHAHPAEHFGIAIVEAMSAGAVPIVHKDGGAWFDIVKQGKYGLGYTSINEAVEAVIKALNVGDDYRLVLINEAKAYSYESFKNNVINVLKPYL